MFTHPTTALAFRLLTEERPSGWPGRALRGERGACARSRLRGAGSQLAAIPAVGPAEGSPSAHRSFSFRGPAQKEIPMGHAAQPREMPLSGCAACAACPGRELNPLGVATSRGELRRARGLGPGSPGPTGEPAPETRARLVLAARPRLRRQRGPPSPPNRLLLFSLSRRKEIQYNKITFLI